MFSCNKIFVFEMFIYLRKGVNNKKAFADTVESTIT